MDTNTTPFTSKEAAAIRVLMDQPPDSSSTKDYFLELLKSEFSRVQSSVQSIKDNQTEMVRAQERMHEANQKQMKDLGDSLAAHATSDSTNFSLLRESLNALAPVKNLVYGAVAIILMSVVGALVALVVMKRG